MSLSEYLRRIGLGEYAPAFEANHIDETLAKELSDADLKEIGIASLGHRRKILAALADISAGEDVTERRDVVILCADLVGSTELTRSLDTEDAFSLMKALLALIDDAVNDAGGAVERHVGDAVMAVLGLPYARGDEALRASRLALTLHAAAIELSSAEEKLLQLRIGVAYGQVVARMDSQRDFSVVGPTVNLAARLASAANPGKTLISDSVRQTCGPVLKLGDAQVHQFKGFSEAMRCWELLGFTSGEGHRPVGRQSELRFFDMVLSDLESSGTGRLVILRGEAGIGKSTLLSMWIERSRKVGMGTHVTRILDFGSAQSFELRADLIKWLMTRGAPEPEHMAWLRAMAEQPLTAAQSALVEAATRETRLERERLALRGLVQAASRSGTLLLAFEDVHWANGQMLDLLAILSELSNELPLLVVATIRTESELLAADWRARIGRTQAWDINLGPLGLNECQMVAEAILGSALSAQNAIQKSRGHPLYLEQLLRHGIENETTGLPPSIHTLIQARIDLLGRADRRAARAAAVLGQNVSAEALRHLLDDPQFHPVNLVERHILRPTKDGFMFHHALIRESVYQTIMRPEREAFHRAAADWFTQRDLARRAEHLAQIAAPEAAEAYLAASEAAAKGLHFSEAAQLARTGISMVTDRTVKCRLALSEARAMMESLGAQAAIPLFARAEELAGDAVKPRLEAQIGRISAMRMADQMEEASALTQQAEEDARATNDLAALSEVLYLKGALLFPTGTYAASLAAHNESLQLAEQIGAPERQALALSGRGDALYAQGRMRSAREVFEHCLSLCETHDLNRVKAANLFMRGTVRIYALDFEGALDDASRSADLAHELGHTRAEIVSRLTVGWVHAWNGNWDDATAQAQRGLKLAELKGAHRFRPFLTETLGYIAYRTGARTRAVSLLREAVYDLRALGAERFIGPWVLGSLALAEGPGDAQDQLQAEAEDLLAQGAVGHNHFQFRRLAIDAAIEAERPQEALRHADALEAYTVREPTEWCARECRRARQFAARES